jgi:hypothetical protein
VTPTWGVDLPAHQVKATWLSHAAFLVEMPREVEAVDTKPEGVKGLTVLFDPAFSDRCSPTQLFGGNLRFSRELTEEIGTSSLNGPSLTGSSACSSCRPPPSGYHCERLCRPSSGPILTF